MTQAYEFSHHAEILLQKDTHGFSSFVWRGFCRGHFLRESSLQTGSAGGGLTDTVGKASAQTHFKSAAYQREEPRTFCVSPLIHYSFPQRVDLRSFTACTTDRSTPISNTRQAKTANCICCLQSILMKVATCKRPKIALVQRDAFAAGRPMQHCWRFCGRRLAGLFEAIYRCCSAFY